MKKYIYIILSLFLFMPFMVNAETVTYNVCESGCEYDDLSIVRSNIQSLGDLSDKDIVINITLNHGYIDTLGSESNRAKSITINGNNIELGYFNLYADTIVLNEVKTYNSVNINNPKKITITNSSIYEFDINLNDNSQTNLREIIDNDSLNSINMLVLIGNVKIDNMDFSNTIIAPAGEVEIHNSIISAIICTPYQEDVTTNIYNSSFDKLKYKNLTIMEDYMNELMDTNTYYLKNINDLNNSLYDINIPDAGLRGTANTTVYFDKEATVKAGNKLDLSSYLDYYTEDKEIEYTIEDESIAKIDNKELTALKEGSTKVTVTTDEGHVIYRINLIVEKETIPEKIDKMTIKVPITGSKLKLWVLIVGGILLGIALICVYMLIKRKK